MSENPTYELGIATKDGWVVAIITDKPITLGETRVESIIVQPREDYDKRVANDPDALRILYSRNAEGKTVFNWSNEKLIDEYLQKAPLSFDRPVGKNVRFIEEKSGAWVCMTLELYRSLQKIK